MPSELFRIVCQGGETADSRPQHCALPADEKPSMEMIPEVGHKFVYYSRHATGTDFYVIDYEGEHLFCFSKYGRFRILIG